MSKGRRFKCLKLKQLLKPENWNIARYKKTRACDDHVTKWRGNHYFKVLSFQAQTH